MNVPKLTGAPLYYYLSGEMVVLLLRAGLIQPSNCVVYDSLVSRTTTNGVTVRVPPVNAWYPKWFLFCNQVKYRLCGVTHQRDGFAAWWQGPAYPDVGFEQLIHRLSDQTGQRFDFEVKPDLYAHLDSRFVPKSWRSEHQVKHKDSKPAKGIDWANVAASALFTMLLVAVAIALFTLFWFFVVTTTPPVDAKAPAKTIQPIPCPHTPIGSTPCKL